MLMKQFLLSTLLTLMIPMMTSAQTYNSLWKQVNDAENNDLPRSEQEALEKIVHKAETEKEYGQLLKAELQYSRSLTSVSADSLKPAVERLKMREQNADNEVLRAIYQCVLGFVYTYNDDLGDDHVAVGRDYYDKSVANPEALAAVKATAYVPFVERGSDSRIYDDDLLSVICYEANRFDVLHDYYVSHNAPRRATMMASLQLLRQQRPAEMEKLNKSRYLQSLDSLIDLYSDLTEAGEIAIERYSFMDEQTDATAEQKWQYINMALDRWGSWQRMNELRRAQHQLTQLTFNAEVEHTVAIPYQPQAVKLTNLRGINSITMRVYRVKTTVYQTEDPNYEYGYKRIKPKLEATDIAVTRTYMGKQAYELYDDSMTLQGLPIGVYMLEFDTQPATSVQRMLFHVSDIRTLVLPLPDEKLRYVVVNATTGQPVKGATLTLWSGWNGEEKLSTLTTDSKGEAIYKQNVDNRVRRVEMESGNDRFCPPLYGSGRYSSYNSDRVVRNAAVYTDRAIYRPGQTVHVGAILYQTTKGYINQVEPDRTIRISLRDANYKTIDEKKVTTDDQGTCSADFTLPTGVLNGSFTVIVDGKYHSIRVEEYKRPTFEVTFPEVNEHYEDGDTLVVKATARSYAGVPVQGAKVKYRVERRRAYWWFVYSRWWDQGAFGTGSEDETISQGETVTDDNGQFTVEMEMTLPKTRHPMFYNFVVTADVTDQGGETHQAQMSLPLGNRKTAFSTTLPEKVLADSRQQVMFNLRNAAGIDITAKVRYRIDKGAWQQTKTATSTQLPTAGLKSGRHTLTAICENDTLEREFTLFALNDQRPAVDTDDWFYITDNQFPNDGTPVTLQVGSSAADVHMVYAIMTNDELLESNTEDKSNELVNRKFTYKEDFGNGLLVTYAWVKNGITYSHTTRIKRPTPDKQLQLQWHTFRDKLKPGQQEEWTLSVVTPDGAPANAQLMATLYDKSLDQIVGHNWTFAPYEYLPMPSSQWSFSTWGSHTLNGFKTIPWFSVSDLYFNHFNHEIYPSEYYMYQRARLLSRLDGEQMVLEEAERVMASPMMAKAAGGMNDAIGAFNTSAAADEEAAENEESADESNDSGQQDEVQMRENLQETAFFYPQLMADSTGQIVMKFTLPESLTTWRFLGVAHTKDMMYGTIGGETVAQKDVMIQPNMPRFIRMGDKAAITARLFNITDTQQSGTAQLQLIDPETEKVLSLQQQQVSIDANGTATVTFTVDATQFNTLSLLIAKVSIAGKTFSDGEQHYLPLLPDRERVTVTVPFTQNEPGTKTIDLETLVPVDDPQGKLTIEYTNNPAWLMIQALPSVAHAYDDCAICQASSYYANAIGRHILRQNPNAKNVFEMWKRESTEETTLMSSLQKNQELKDMVLAETPWVADADREVEQKQRLADFFDKNTMDNRINGNIDKLKKLQRSDGSWSWWPDMPGSFYMTMEVTEMLVRLNNMAGQQSETGKMLDKAFTFLGNDIVEMVKEMKKEEKRGIKQTFPSYKALQWLYACELDGRKLPNNVNEANTYLKNLLKKENKSLTIYGKAMAAIILENKTYIKSLKEYTVYREDMGRYYDTGKALYSWYDYRIPTQVAAIEALQRLTPEDHVTVSEMQRWLLQSKRTQAWDTPINSANAIYAFLNGEPQKLAAQPQTALRVNGQQIDTPAATAGLGYVKTAMPTQGAKTFEAEKTSTGTSWGAVYAQFMQPSHDISDQQSGIKVTREILTTRGNSSLSTLHSSLPKDSSLFTLHSSLPKDSSLFTLHSSLKVGDRITVRITIEADRDYDFVQVTDKRAACMEPVNQMSGYQWRSGYYCSPKDFCTNYFFDMLRKGKHVIETDYYIDREGTYETGTCTAQCAYSPEFRGTTKSVTLKVER